MRCANSKRGIQPGSVSYYEVVVMDANGEELGRGTALGYVEARSLMVDLWVKPGAQEVCILQYNLPYGPLGVTNWVDAADIAEMWTISPIIVSYRQGPEGPWMVSHHADLLQ